MGLLAPLGVGHAVRHAGGGEDAVGSEVGALMLSRRRARTSWCLAALCASGLWATLASAADIAVIKSSEVAAWQPALGALRSLSAMHTLDEFTLGGNGAAAALARARTRAVAIIAFGAPAARLAREQAPQVALIYCMVADPVSAGLAGAPNTTGIVFSAPVRNELLTFRTINPKAVRLGTIVSSARAQQRVEEAHKAAEALGLEIVVRKLGASAEVPPAVRDLLSGAQPVDALWLVPDPLVADANARRFLMAEAVRVGRPVYGWSSELVAEGALLAHGPDAASVGQSAIAALARILAGQKTERIVPLVPQSQVTVNRSLARYLGLKLTPEVERAVTLF